MFSSPPVICRRRMSVSSSTIQSCTLYCAKTFAKWYAQASFASRPKLRICPRRCADVCPGDHLCGCAVQNRGSNFADVRP
eukprot:2807891-Pyramimonas_sp.AAC.2